MNFKKITKHCYKVKNQEGVIAAVSDFFGQDYSQERILDMIQNYPEYYCDTVIVIVNQSFECNRVYIEYFDIDEEAHAASY